MVQLPSLPGLSAMMGWIMKLLGKQNRKKAQAFHKKAWQRLLPELSECPKSTVGKIRCQQT
jgi:hypothetical protein